MYILGKGFGYLIKSIKNVNFSVDSKKVIFIDYKTYFKDL